MKFYAFQRYNFTGQMYLPQDDPLQDQPVLTFIKDIVFDFASDPATPRQVIISEEPLPTLTQITGVKDRYGNFPMPLAEWTVTGIEPVFDMFGGKELYRHLAALSKTSDFGYEVARPN
jgi:hypothetical protein